MGCASSKVDNEEGVARCRARKKFMKHAVASRHAFASAHAQYVQALKTSGGAFRDFAEGESFAPPPQIAPPTPLLMLPEPPLPPPPPPLSPRLPPSPPREVKVEPLLLDSKPSSFPSPPQEKLSPSPPSIPSTPVHEEWRYYNAPPPPPPPLDDNFPIAATPRSSWHHLFIDPFRPEPELQFRPPSPPMHLTVQRKIRQKEAEGEHKKLKEEEGMPDLEDVGAVNGEDDGGEEAYLRLVKKSGGGENGHHVVPLPPPAKPETAIVERNMNSALVEHKAETSIVNVKSDNNKELVIAERPPPKGRDLLDVLREVDDLFLRSSESGEPICKMLETKKVHYHSSFSEIKGIADHPSKVFNSTFWSRSLSRSSSSGLLRDLSHDAFSESAGMMMGSHASTLDRLFAWEKKLYDEVKAAEVIRVDLEKKCSLLRSQDAKGDDPNSIDKTRAAIKVLHTRFMVALQAVDAASGHVQQLRDEELFPQLLELLEGMTSMWKEMNECHQYQQRVVQEMKSLENSAAADATSNSHSRATQLLAASLTKWAQTLQIYMSTQREYTNNLTGWLRLSLLQPGLEDDPREGHPSPVTNVGATPIYSLCQDWHRALDRLPDKTATEAINGFVAIVNEWIRLQSEELRHKKKAEALERELSKKEQFMEMLERKYVDSSTVADEKEDLVTDSPRRTALNENKARLDTFRRKVDQEKEEVEKSIHATRAMTLSTIETGLPGVFQALSGFATVAYQMYRDLHAQGANSKLARITDK